MSLFDKSPMPATSGTQSHALRIARLLARVAAAHHGTGTVPRARLNSPAAAPTLRSGCIASPGTKHA
jgi:hypothetical protein